MKIRQHVLGSLGVCLLYLASAKLGLKYAVIGQTVTLLWPPSGIALAATLIGGYRMWPAIALGAFMANVGTDVPLITLAMITLGNTLEPLVGAFLLRFKHQFSIALDQVSDVMALIAIGTFGSTMVAASFGALGLLAGEEITLDHFGSTWLTWWLGDGMGVLVISPALLTGFVLTKEKPFPVVFSWPKVLEIAILALTLTIVGQIIFGNVKITGLGNFTTSLAIFPFAIWSALRFGSLGAAIVALAASLLAINGTVNGTGPFIADNELESLILWCLFADLIAVTGLILAAVNGQRHKAINALQSANENLEMEVKSRTDDLLLANCKLQATLDERKLLYVEMNQICEERQKLIGQELHDGLGQQLTGASLLATSLHEILAAKSASEEPLALQVKQQLDEATSMVRSLARGLYPVALESGSLSSALKHLALYSQSSSDIQCFVKATIDDFQLDKDTQLNLYRIAQEAVCNALRHSKAQRIDINLSRSGNHYLFLIEDNGIGLETNNIKSAESLGLRSMRSRADLIGAVLDVKLSSSGGTAIVVNGPLKPVE
ncbi:MASE1 domain-containing protein [Methylicorpusculum oleiharenae]|uniref:sensor histidine kinase n=1 Tax=Methylicorpusculum oleiharenae TaxID=1338687 RepID=UPI00135960E6|nr:MASE1 domain-containing protein [Methylicorpusculum oleiharenae]MCD2452322.1 MASE1 domain-containing protein [Methylicorpusculum oleiharenae]